MSKLYILNPLAGGWEEMCWVGLNFVIEFKSGKGRHPKKTIESLTAVKPGGEGGQRVGGHTSLGFFPQAPNLFVWLKEAPNHIL